MATLPTATYDPYEAVLSVQILEFTADQPVTTLRIDSSVDGKRLYPIKGVELRSQWLA